MLPRLIRLILLLASALACGCASPVRGRSEDLLLVVPGVGGAGREYQGLIHALSASQRRSVQVVGWGAPLPLFFLNFSSDSIHAGAEKALARRIADWRASHPDGRIDLLGHSAGGGVVAGGLGMLDPGVRIQRVILLEPSLSPSYDLHPALEHVAGTMHVFYSDRDTALLSWRTSHFGTYDGVKTQAAGHVGFAGSYPPDKLVQHPYRPEWQALGHDGGHWGPLAEPFVRQVLLPLLDERDATASSSRR